MPTLIERIGARIAQSRMEQLGRAIDCIITWPWRVIKLRLAIIKVRRAPESFAIERRDNSVTFVEAHDFIIDAEGRLVFYRRRGVCVAAYSAGEWTRVMRGLSFEDIEEGR